MKSNEYWPLFLLSAKPSTSPQRIQAVLGKSELKVRKLSDTRWLARTVCLCCETSFSDLIQTLKKFPLKVAMQKQMAFLNSFPSTSFAAAC